MLHIQLVLTLVKQVMFCLVLSVSWFVILVTQKLHG